MGGSLKPMTDVLSKWAFLVAICSLQGVVSSSWKKLSTTAVATCGMPFTHNDLLAIVYLQ